MSTYTPAQRSYYERHRAEIIAAAREYKARKKTDPEWAASYAARQHELRIERRKDPEYVRRERARDAAREALFPQRKQARMEAWRARYQLSGRPNELGDKLKYDVLGHYSAPAPNPICVKCGFDNLDALCLDHINDDGVIERRHKHWTGRKLYQRLKREGFPVGYQTLCANCNTIKLVELFRLRRRGARAGGM